MKYRIKNEAIEKAVRGLFKTQEAFEKQLNAWSEYHFKYYHTYSCIKIVANSAESITGYACELYVATSDVEEVVDYDPKKWNEYSKVKPPENVWMRCEMHTIDSIRKVGAIFQDGEWRNHEGCSYRTSGWYCVRFKPWDDEGGGK